MIFGQKIKLKVYFNQTKSLSNLRIMIKYVFMPLWITNEFHLLCTIHIPHIFIGVNRYNKWVICKFYKDTCFERKKDTGSGHFDDAKNDLLAI